MLALGSCFQRLCHSRWIHGVNVLWNHRKSDVLMAWQYQLSFLTKPERHHWQSKAHSSADTSWSREAASCDGSRVALPSFSYLHGFILPFLRPLSWWHSLSSIDKRRLETKGASLIFLVSVKIAPSDFEFCNQHWLILRISIALERGVK